MHSQPIRHHYIPQFILRSFCFDEKHLYYFNKQTRDLSIKETRDVFMEKNLYRDEINNLTDPVKIERDLAVYEREVAMTIREKFLDNKEFTLSAEENAKLKLFFAIMGFRSRNTSLLFEGRLSQESKDFYKTYQLNGNFTDLWKRNLGYIVNCRSVEQVLEHPDIDEPFKLFFHRDTVGLTGTYLAVGETDERNSLVIGDTYPVVIDGETTWGLKLRLYDIYPITPKRVIFLVQNGAKDVPKDVLQLRSFILYPPKCDGANNGVKIRVKKLCADEVQYINRTISENAKQGFAVVRPSEKTAE